MRPSNLLLIGLTGLTATCDFAGASPISLDGGENNKTSTGIRPYDKNNYAPQNNEFDNGTHDLSNPNKTIDISPLPPLAQECMHLQANHREMANFESMTQQEFCYDFPNTRAWLYGPVFACLRDRTKWPNGRLEVFDGIRHWVEQFCAWNLMED